MLAAHASPLMRVCSSVSVCGHLTCPTVVRSLTWQSLWEGCLNIPICTLEWSHVELLIAYQPIPLASGLCLHQSLHLFTEYFLSRLLCMGKRTWQGNFQVWEAGDLPMVTQLVAGEEPGPNPAGSKFQSHCILVGKGQLEMFKNGGGTFKWT